MTPTDLLALVARLREHLTLLEPLEDIDPDVRADLEALETGLREHDRQDASIARGLTELLAGLGPSSRESPTVAIIPIDCDDTSTTGSMRPDGTT